jgi:hypothetical protein
VNGFVACRSFWLVLDSSDRTGVVDYRLDARGALAALTFRQEEGAAPVRGVMLRIPGEARDVKVEGGTPADPAPQRRTPGYTDFRWECAGAWKASVTE